MAYVYIVKCEDDSLYTGITTNLENRMRNHVNGKGTGHAKYMRSHTPVEIMMVWQTEEYKNAAKLEYAIKSLKRADKLNLIKNPDSISNVFPKLSEYSFLPMDKVALKDCLKSGE